MRLSPAWEEAVRELTEYSLTALSGAMSPYRLRRGCVERYFGAKVKLAEIAEKCRVNRNTVGQHNQAITKLMKSVEHRAWGAFDELVNERGMLLVDA